MEHQHIQNAPPLVSIITINHNDSSATLNLIGSLQKVTYHNIEVIVVDNASDISEINILIYNKGHFTLIELNKKVGKATAINAGIRLSKGEFVFLLNNHCTVERDCIEPMLETLTNNPAIAVVSPEVTTIETDIKSTENKTLGSPNDQITKNEVKDNRPTFTDYAHESAMMIPRSIIEKTCLMPEMYQNYLEELDWVTNIKKAGYNIYYQPKSTVYIHQFQTESENSAIKTYYIFRNRIIFSLRNSKGVKRILSILFQLFIILPQNIILFLRKNEIDNIKASIRGSFWGIKHLFDKKLYLNKTN